MAEVSVLPIYNFDCQKLGTLGEDEFAENCQQDSSKNSISARNSD
jgi:hypothetical protein